MSKYREIFKITWYQYLAYRVNFALWRVRSSLQLLLVYFIWWSIFQSQKEVLGYTTSSILTYVLVAALLRAIVIPTTVTDLIDAINTGSVVNFLIKPLGFVRYYLARDTADKLFNICFYIVEVTLLFFLLKPPIILQTNILSLILFLLATLGALVIYFCMNFMISLTAFWVDNSWGPLFLMSILLESLGGTLFPIDILPKPLFNFLMFTPFPYLIYFPAKLYLGGFDYLQVLQGFLVVSFWVVALILLTRAAINAGFRHFSAVGS